MEAELLGIAGTAIGLVLTSLVGYYVPRLTAALEARAHIAVTDQQRAAIMNAATTAAGLLAQSVASGRLFPSSITPDHPDVRAAAKAALDRVPAAAAEQGVSVNTMQTLIAARVPLVVAAVAPPAPVSTGVGIAGGPNLLRGFTQDGTRNPG